MKYFKIVVLTTLALLCQNFMTKAQWKKLPGAATIHVGEQVPDAFFDGVYLGTDMQTGKEIKISLKDHRNKLVILDFWASWCGPCVGSLIHLNELVPKLPSEVVIVPVTYQEANEAASLLKNYNWNFKGITRDSIFSNWFPHRGLPHQVWIYQGKLFATPWHTYASIENFKKVLAGEKVYLANNAQDRMVDPLKPIFVKGNGETVPYLKKRDALIARHVDGYMRDTVQLLNTKDSTFLYAVNNSMQQLLYSAYRKDIHPKLDINTGMQWEVDTTLQYAEKQAPSIMAGDEASGKALESWLKKNTYGYSLRHAKMETVKAYGYMQSDLVDFFKLYKNLNIEIVQLPRKFMVLRAIRDTSFIVQQLKSKANVWENKSDKHYRRGNGREFGYGFRMQIQIMAKTSFELIDSTGINNKLIVDYEFPKSAEGNLVALNKTLSNYGLSLTIEDVYVPVLRIKQN